MRGERYGGIIVVNNSVGDPDVYFYPADERGKGDYIWDSSGRGALNGERILCLSWSDEARTAEDLRAEAFSSLLIS